MNTKAFFASPKTLRRIHVGPLGLYVDDFATLLEEQLYSQSSAQGMIRNVAKWSRWLYGHHVEARDVDAVLLEQYLTHLVRIRSLGHEVVIYHHPIDQISLFASISHHKIFIPL